MKKKVSSCPRGRTYAKCGGSSAPPFIAKRGVGQGDNHSPLTWLLFEDIILCAMDAVKADPLYLQRAKLNLEKANDLCYAGDLLTICGQLAGLQAKADIMSAMALIFKLKFNKTKLRLFLQESGVYKVRTVQPTLEIREVHWDNVLKLNLSSEGEFKSLGFIHSLGGLGSQFGLCLDYVKKVCKIIGSKMAQPKGKILALNVHLFNKTAYIGQYGSWPLSLYRELDVPVQILLRKVTHNLHGHPNRLLYMSRSDGGLQLKKLSDQCQMAKYALMHRSLYSDPVTSASMDSLLLRSARRQGKGYGDTHVSLGPSGLSAGLWANSLVEWFYCNGLKLNKNGPTSRGMGKDIAAFCGASKVEQNRLAKSVKAGV